MKPRFQLNAPVYYVEIGEEPADDGEPGAVNTYTIYPGTIIGVFCAKPCGPLGYRCYRPENCGGYDVHPRFVDREMEPLLDYVKEEARKDPGTRVYVYGEDMNGWGYVRIL